MQLSRPMQDFVRHWGEMGSRWGVNRSVAQVHALLLLADRPLAADEVVETLGIARSNVSNSLKELQSYRLVELVHLIGDRRDHFVAVPDPWDMVLAIVEERKRRELDPAIAMLRDCAAAADADPETPDSARRRLAAISGLVSDLDRLYIRLLRLPRTRLRRIVQLGDKIIGLLQR